MNYYKKLLIKLLIMFKDNSLFNQSNDTIFAPITAVGGAIFALRICGDDAINIIKKLTDNQSFKPRSRYAELVNIYIDGKFLDEVIVIYFPKNSSFNGDETIEIFLHGGRYVFNKITEKIISLEVRYAYNGEFTKRAVLNGKIDLIKSEGIYQIINADSELEHNSAVNAYNGKITEEYSKWRDLAIQILSIIEVNIDFSDEDRDETILSTKKIVDLFFELKNSVENVYKNRKLSEVNNNGLDIVIIGKPNVGKSSLINKLANQDIAIVSSKPGTTRDFIKLKMIIGGVVLNIVDSAGIRRTEDEIESIGVSRALYLAKESLFNLILFKSIDDLENLEYQIRQQDILILNQIDLLSSQEINDIIDKVLKKYDNSIIKISALQGQGISDVLEEINFNIKDHIKSYNYNKDSMLLNTRQMKIVEEIFNKIYECSNFLKENVYYEILSEKIYEIAKLIGELSGDVINEDILDSIFSKFCIGK